MISQFIEETRDTEKKKRTADSWEVFPGMTVCYVQMQENGQDGQSSGQMQTEEPVQESRNVQEARNAQGAASPEHVEAIFCMRGRVQVRMCKETALTICPGELFLMTKKAAVSELSVLGSSACFLAADILIEEARAIPVPFDALLHPGQLREFFAANRSFYVLQDLMWGNSLLDALSCLKKEQYSAYFALRLLERLCLLSCKAASKTEAEFVQEKELYYDSYQRERIQDVHMYLQENYGMHLTIQNLADRFQISPTFLKACFRHVYGQPIHSYLQQYRLRMAAHLLATTSDSVLSIAMKIGYSGTSRFGVAFKEMYHMTPTKFRSQSRRKNV